LGIKPESAVASGIYRFCGWEDVDSRRCVRIEFVAGAGKANEGKSGTRFWLDLERGARPLRFELVQDWKPAARVDEVRLMSFTGRSGKELWLPVAARYRSFLANEKKILSEPTTEVIYKVVLDSVRVDEKLPDSTFSVFHKPGVTTAKQVAEAEREFQKTRQSNDFASVRQRLATNLVVADRQAKRIEVEVGDDSLWGAVNRAIPVVLIGGGVVCVAAFAVVKLRRVGA
jgi:hypothetical protein